jgi:hypothetical protein
MTMKGERMAFAPKRKKAPPARYTVTLPRRVENDLEQIAEDLEITKSEAFRRALSLFRHAVEADKVTITKKGEEHTVLVK